MIVGRQNDLSLAIVRNRYKPNLTDEIQTETGI